MTWLHWQKMRMRVTAGTLLLLFLATTSPGIGWVPEVLATVQQDLERAQDLYDFAEFQQALDIATALISAGQLTETEERDAYVIRARSAAQMGLESQAREDFCTVNKLDQTWRPDPVMFPQDEIDAFDVALLDCKVEVTEPVAETGEEGKPWYMKPVVWAGAAGVVLLAVVVGGGGGDDGDDAAPALSDFPDPPDD